MVGGWLDAYAITEDEDAYWDAFVCSYYYLVNNYFNPESMAIGVW